MIVLTHRLHLKHGDGEIAFAVRLFRPEPHDGAWACRYEIDWPEGQRTFAAVGFDALQALLLALQMIGAEIYASDHHRKGRLRAYEGDEGYGFPVAASLRDLLVGLDRVAV